VLRRKKKKLKPELQVALDVLDQWKGKKVCLLQELQQKLGKGKIKYSRSI